MARITIPDAFPKLSEVATRWGKQVNDALKEVRSAIGLVDSKAEHATRAASSAVNSAAAIVENIDQVIIPRIEAPQSIAAPPENLDLVSTTSAWDEYGGGVSEATIEWDGVELDVNSNPIDIAGYEILSATAGSVEVARNLVDDPSFEAFVGPVTSAGGTVTASTAWVKSGVQSIKLTPSSASSYAEVALTDLVPGQAYTVVYTMRRAVVGTDTSSTGYGGGVYGGPPTYGT